LLWISLGEGKILWLGVADLDDTVLTNDYGKRN